MKKSNLIIFFSLLVILSAFARAEITITNMQDKYNLGDEIAVNVGFNGEFDETVIFGVSILCNDESEQIEYYRTLFKDSLEVPAFPISQQNLGKCYLKTYFEDLNGEMIEDANSEEFSVDDSIDLEILTDKPKYNPGERVIINGNANTDNPYNITIVIYDNNSTIKEIVDYLEQNTFEYEFNLASLLSRGTKRIVVNIEDGMGNKGGGGVGFEVNQIPTHIDLQIGKKSFRPLENVSFISSVYDQSSELIELPVEYTILNEKNAVFDSFSAFSGNEELLELEEFARPGNYSIEVNYGNLKDQKNFEVEQVKQIVVESINGSVLVQNMGNVWYREEIYVNASSEGVVYRIPLSVNLGPGEKKKVDISESLPSNSYNLSLFSEEEVYVLEGVEVQDNRGVVKKLSQQIAKITGSSIIETEQVNNVFVVGFVVLLLGFLIIFVLQRSLRKEVRGVVKEQGIRIRGLKGSLSIAHKKRKQLRDIFDKYVDHNVLEHHKEGVHKKEISVLFTDIRGFAKLFDQKDSDEITAILNMYFRKTNEIVKKYHGFVNKFVGDSVMALFNATVEDKYHLLHAIKSGVEIKKEIAILNERLKKKGVNPIEVGVGIDSGISSVGNIGSKEKLEYTAIGIPVNVAFRLQGMSEGKVLITERIYKIVKAHVEAELIGKFNLKNIIHPVNVYGVVSVK